MNPDYEKRMTDLQEKPITKMPPMYKVILHNDNVNSFDHVIATLQKIFHFEYQKAVNFAIKAHKFGKTIIIIIHRERAELYQEQMLLASLTASIEKV